MKQLIKKLISIMSKKDKKEAKADKEVMEVKQEQPKTEHEAIFSWKKEVEQVPTEKDTLKTVQQLNEMGIKENSPEYLKFPKHFRDQFTKMLLLIEVSNNKHTVSKKAYQDIDAELYAWLIDSLKEKDVDPLEGNIRNILEQIAADQKSSIYDIGIMINKHINVLLLNKDSEIIMHERKAQTISIERLAGKSKVLSFNNIVKAFNRDAHNFNADEIDFIYIIKVVPDNNELVCALYRNMAFIKQRSIESWMSVSD